MTEFAQGIYQFDRPCPRCGVAAVDKPVHERWHAELDEALSNAAQGNVGPNPGKPEGETK